MGSTSDGRRYIVVTPFIGWVHTRDHSGYGLSQWQKALNGNVFSHWLNPYPEWSCYRFLVDSCDTFQILQGYFISPRQLYDITMTSSWARWGLNHPCLDCFLNCLFRLWSKKTSNLRVTGLCEGNSPVTGEFPTQRASNAENVSIWWRHHQKGNYEGYGKIDW